MGGAQRWLPVVFVSVAALPLAALVVVLLARWRIGSGVARQTAWRHSAAEVGMVAGTAPWIWMILTPLPGAADVRLVPLRDLWLMLNLPPASAFVQVVGNLLVFVAFGFFAVWRWGIGVWPVVAVAAGGSVLVEALQHLLQLGRVTSVDDVLLNAAGAGLAARAAHRFLPPGAVRNSVSELRRGHPK